MVRVLKIAALSAGLAAALVTVMDRQNAKPSPARFLTDRLETTILPAGEGGKAAATPSRSGLLTESCQNAWPYRQSCDAAPAGERPQIRVIAIDRAPVGTGAASHATLVAQR